MHSFACALAKAEKSIEDRFGDYKGYLGKFYGFVCGSSLYLMMVFIKLSKSELSS